MTKHHSASFVVLARTAPMLGICLASVLGCSSSDNQSLITGASGAGHGGSSGTGHGGSAASNDASSDGPGFIVGSGGTNGADAEPLPDGACALNTLKATTREVNILLVIDKSGSMTNKPAGFATDKWTAMKDALSTALVAVEKNLSFGLELYPLSSDPQKPIPVQCTGNCCDMPPAPGINVAVAAGTTSVPSILSALNGTAPGGGTPTAEALKRAYAYFTGGAGKSLNGEKYVLLATDGGPNCDTGAPPCDSSKCTLNLDGLCPLPADAGGGNCCDTQFEGPGLCLDDQQTKLQIQNLNGAGIKTFVVGIPGSEAYKTYLDEFAVAGGEENPAAPPSYFAVSATGGVSELTTVLSSITKKLITTCELHLTSNPADFGKINVFVDGREIKRDDPNGWVLDSSTTPATIDLKGTTCTEVETKGAESVRIVFGCKSIH